METLPDFDPYNRDHVKAWRSFTETGIWPPETDVKERGSNPVWVVTIQSKLAEAWVTTLLNSVNSWISD